MRQFTSIPSKNAPKKKMFQKAPTVAQLVRRGGTKGFKKMADGQ